MPKLDNIVLNGTTYDLGGGDMTAEFKIALETLLENVSYKGNDPTGRTYLNDLHTAMYPPENLSYITAVYTQSGVVRTADSLNVLKPDLVVTAHYTNGTSGIVTFYTLSGTLEEGTSTITVAYFGKTTTFNVVVESVSVPNDYTAYDYITASTGGPVDSDARIELKEYSNINVLSAELWFSPRTGVPNNDGAAYFGLKRQASGNNGSYALYARDDGLLYQLHGVEGMITASVINEVNHAVYTNTDGSPSQLKLNDNNPVNIEWVNNNTITGKPTLFSNPLNYGSMRIYTTLQIGKIKFYDLTGELVSWYVPVVRKSDNVVGMYEAVDGVFYTTSTESYATIGDSAQRYAVGNWV